MLQPAGLELVGRGDVEGWGPETRKDTSEGKAEV